MVRPWLRIPFIARRTPLVVQALLGESSFTMHEYIPRKGRIAIGGVDETIWCSRIFHTLKARLAEELGEEKRDALILSVSEEMGWFEADAAITSGRWIPKAFQGMFEDPGLLDLVRTDEAFRKLFVSTMNIAIRLIFNEGGWGNVKSFDVSSNPIIIRMNHLQEPIHSGPSATPVCTYIRGYLTGFLSRLLHVKATAEELSCAAQGHDECVFALYLNIKKTNYCSL
jgi:hypothetical protein